MTQQQKREIRTFIWQRIGIWAIGGALWCLTVMLMGILTPLGSRAQAIWHSPERLEVIDEKLDRLSKQLAAATGENRVIRQVGLSYIEEPVYQGENVILYLSVERTTLGRSCRLVGSVPLFTDERNITIPGRRANEAATRRQISDRPVRIRSEWVTPQTLQPGRVELVLALEYNCDGTIVPESTEPVAFDLVAGPRP